MVKIFRSKFFYLRKRDRGEKRAFSGRWNNNDTQITSCHKWVSLILGTKVRVRAREKERVRASVSVRVRAREREISAHSAIAFSYIGELALIVSLALELGEHLVFLVDKLKLVCLAMP